MAINKGKKELPNSQLITFLLQDYEQTWGMIRHNDNIRMEWLKYYLNLLTAAGTILIASLTLNLQNPTPLINSNLLLLILIVAETAGVLTLAFHTSTRIRNIQFLQRLDTIRSTVLSISKVNLPENKWKINPKWISFLGMDSFIAYLLASINAALFAAALASSGVETYANLIYTACLFVLLLLSYFGVLFYQKRSSRQ